MRVGIFGGTFDPPHVGHLLAASDAVEALALDRLLIIPAAEQPLKAGIVMASAAQRLEMTRRLAGSDPRFVVDPVEIERGGLSFTVDTLRTLRARFAADSELALFLLIGADVLTTLPKWREPDALRALAEVVVLTRDGGGELPPGMQALKTRRVDVSSTEIRTRVRDGRSIRGFVPDAVADYIATERLYR
jgi:nicotinate-nucleotide adenylyltransferase